MTRFRILEPGEEQAVDAFLAGYPDTSLMLRANLHAAGLADHGRPSQATYAAAFQGGRIEAVAAHCWNGVLLLEAPSHIVQVVRLAVAASGRSVSGLIGPRGQVVDARRALGLAEAPTATDSSDLLYTLALAALKLPSQLTAPGITCCPAREADRELLIEWRAAFSVEALGFQNSPALRISCREQVELLERAGDLWVLRQEDLPIACATINARIREAVTVGGVWTIPAERGRGYARTAVAGMLEAQRARGVTRAVLFADRSNVSARRAYEALGFQAAGDYGLVLFHEPQPLGTAP